MISSLRAAVARLLPRPALSLLAALGACRREATSAVVSAGEFRLVDGGRTRATLAVDKGAPALALFDGAGKPRLRLGLGADEQPSVALFAPARVEPQATMELDDKGAHVLLRGPGKQESYLFQKSDGTAGVVLVGQGGTHRAQLLLSPTGEIDWTLRDDAGRVRRAITVDGQGHVKDAREEATP